MTTEVYRSERWSYIEFGAVTTLIPAVVGGADTKYGVNLNPHPSILETWKVAIHLSDAGRPSCGDTGQT